MPAIKYDYETIEHRIKPGKRYATPPIKKENKKTNVGTVKAPANKIMVLNFVLLCACGALAFLFVAIYSVVALSESKLSNLHSKISEMNYENTELENKLENVKSYYSVDTKVSANASFDKAKNVLEVDKVDAKKIKHLEPKNNSLNTITGF